MKIKGKNLDHVLWCLDFVDGYYGGPEVSRKGSKRNRRLAKKIAKKRKIPKSKRTGTDTGRMMF